jgi:hypothetical protein
MPSDKHAAAPGAGPGRAGDGGPSGALYAAGDLSVVIPAFNEAQAIATTLATLRAALPQAEVIVVDDGSSDATAEVARGVQGVRVIAHGFNRGYGAAIKTGMLASTRAHIAWFDADNEHRVEDLVEMKRLLDREDLAAVLGRRRQAGVTAFRAVGKTVIRAVARSLGLNVGRDLNCGLRVFRRMAIMPYLSVLPDSYSASTTSTMILAERQYPVQFYDIDTNPRIGQSKVQIRHGFGTIAIILRTITLFAPLRIFFGIGLPVILLGAAYSLAIALLRNEGLPAAGVLAMLTGLLLCCFGLLADQISQMRLLQLSQLRAELASEPAPEDGIGNDV